MKGKGKTSGVVKEKACDTLFRPSSSTATSQSMWDNAEEAMTCLNQFIHKDELQATFDLRPSWVAKNLSLVVGQEDS